MYLLCGGHRSFRTGKLLKTNFIPFKMDKFERNGDFILGKNVSVNFTSLKKGNFRTETIEGYSVFYVFKDSLVIHMGNNMDPYDLIRRAENFKDLTYLWDALQSFLKDPNEFRDSVEQNIAENKALRDKEEEDKQKSEQEKRLLAIQQYEDSLNKAKVSFCDKGSINPDYFLELCKRNRISIPLRTIGFIKRHVQDISCDKYYTYGKKRSNSLFLYMKELYTVLTEPPADPIVESLFAASQTQNCA